MRHALIAAFAFLTLSVSAGAQDAAYVFEQGYPTPATSKSARDDADYQRAITAYRFWYPTVSVEGIFNGNREAGSRTMRPWAPRPPGRDRSASRSIRTRPMARRRSTSRKSR